MKNILLLFSLVIVLLTSCTKDDNIAITTAELSNLLSSINVSDAKVIYKKESTVSKSTSRSDSEAVSTFWKLDANGVESQLIISSKDGTANNISIDQISSLSDRFLVMNPNTEELAAITNSYVSSNLRFLVDIQSEKLYMLPEDINYISDLPSWASAPQTTTSGDVYFFSYNSMNEARLYKLDVDNFTIEEIAFPSTIYFYGHFQLFGDGYIRVKTGDGYGNRFGDSYIISPEGALYRIPDIEYDYSMFVFNNELYTTRATLDRDSNENYSDYGPIYRWSEKDGELVAEMLSFNIDSGITYAIYTNVVNPLKNCAYLSYEDSNNATYGKCEFYADKEPVVLDSDISAPSFSDRTSTSWYFFDYDNKIYKMNMEDYTQSTITIPAEYEISTVSASQLSPEIYGTGFRLSDGNNIMLKIAEDNTIECQEFGSNVGSVTTLIPLN